MTTGRIQLLGDVAVVDHEGARSVDPGVRRTVLAFLAVHAAEPVDRQVLIEEAWADHPPHDGAAALHVAVTRIRVQLGQVATVSIAGRRVTLDIDRTHVDLLAFLDAAEVALRTGDRDRRAAALELWQEPVLPDLPSRRLATLRAHVEERHRALYVM